VDLVPMQFLELPASGVLQEVPEERGQPIKTAPEEVDPPRFVIQQHATVPWPLHRGVQAAVAPQEPITVVVALAAVQAVVLGWAPPPDKVLSEHLAAREGRRETHLLLAATARVAQPAPREVGAVEEVDLEVVEAGQEVVARLLRVGEVDHP